MKSYIVGGYVRDLILAESDQTCQGAVPQTAHDRDFVVVGATVDDMLAAGYHQVGAAFPVFLHPETREEYALARRELKTGDRHTDFSFDFSPDTTVDEDAARRDFSINALYLCPDTQVVLDPTGTGLTDLAKGVLRHAGAGFAEDPLRIMRAARFAAQLGFSVAPETELLIRDMVARDMLAHLSRERIDNEFTRAMTAGYDSSAFLNYLLDWGALQQLYPELAAMATVEENHIYHRSATTWGHVMAALDIAHKQSPRVKTAVVYHDVYKPVSYRQQDARGKHLPHDDEKALQYVRDYFAQRMFDRRTKTLCKLSIRYHMRIRLLFDGMSVKKWVDMMAALTNGFRADYQQQLIDFLEVCKADDLSDKTAACFAGKGGRQRWEVFSAVALQTFEVCHAIQARDIDGYAEMGVPQLVDALRRKRITATATAVDFFKNR
ncbi:MAG: hypothetical protein FWE51_03635 [Coriobacteriia bacterium]|nr:hypothetical protein [Coriobacteriia bacterium]